MNAQDVKKLLLGNGFLVYRTTARAVYLAERVRDNLIMDANVSVQLDDPARVRLWVRAQRSDFPSTSETESHLFERARALATDAYGQGFRECATEVVPQLDPMDETNVLDTWYQVAFEKPAADSHELVQMLRYALALDKVAPR